MVFHSLSHVVILNVMEVLMNMSDLRSGLEVTTCQSIGFLVLTVSRKLANEIDLGK